jgi:molybdopterin converting factor small subunit
MAITVLLPDALRPYAANNERVALEATTAGEALRKLIERYPDLKLGLPEDLERLPADSAIYRNSVDLRRLQGLATELRPRDRLTIVVPQPKPTTA